MYGLSSMLISQKTEKMGNLVEATEIPNVIKLSLNAKENFSSN